MANAADSAAPLRHPRMARMLRPADFAGLRHSGKRLSLRFFQCEYRPTEAIAARLGMAVSRRVSKRAVVRNRIRRQIRESFRLNRPALPVCDVLVVARTQAAEQNNAVLRAELDQLWRRLAALLANDPPLNAASPPGTMRGLA